MWKTLDVYNRPTGEIEKKIHGRSARANEKCQTIEEKVIQITTTKVSVRQLYKR